MRRAVGIRPMEGLARLDLAMCCWNRGRRRISRPHDDGCVNATTARDTPAVRRYSAGPPLVNGDGTSVCATCFISRPPQIRIAGSGETNGMT